MKNKVLMVNLPSSDDPGCRNKGGYFIMTGNLVIGSFLTRQGYQVELVDMGYDPNYENRIRKIIDDNTLFVGLSVMTAQVPFLVKIAKFIKEINQDLPIVVGGPHPTFFLEQSIKHPNIDYVVSNEGVNSIDVLARKLKNQEEIDDIPGVSYKKGGKIVKNANSQKDDLDDIVPLDHSFYDPSLYFKNEMFKSEFNNIKDVRAFPLITALGCAYSCKFCINVILKRNYRVREAESVIDEIKCLQEKYGANSFWFLDEDFFIHKKRMFKLFKIVEEEDIKFQWRAWLRVNYFNDKYLNDEVVKWLGKLGWGWSSMGAESGSKETLDLINKKITPEQTLHSAKVLRKNLRRHYPRYTFIIGLPGETVLQMYKTFLLASQVKNLHPDADITVAMFRPYPGSPLSDTIIKENNLTFPDDLEGWEKIVSGDGYLNEGEVEWILKEDRIRIKIWMWYFNIISSCNYGDRLKRVIKKMIYPFAWFRMKNNFFFFPIEYYVSCILRGR